MLPLRKACSPRGLFQDRADINTAFRKRTVRFCRRKSGPQALLHRSFPASTLIFRLFPRDAFRPGCGTSFADRMVCGPAQTGPPYRRTGYEYRRHEVGSRVSHDHFPAHQSYGHAWHGDVSPLPGEPGRPRYPAPRRQRRGSGHRHGCRPDRGLSADVHAGGRQFLAYLRCRIRNCARPQCLWPGRRESDY